MDVACTEKQLQVMLVLVLVAATNFRAEGGNKGVTKTGSIVP
jgi:hypothetical protein